MINKKFFFASFIAITLFSSCSHYGTRIKPTFTPTIKLTTIMYRNSEEQLLFAGPVNLKQSNGKDYIQIDFTALIKNQVCDTVRCNFTVYTHNSTFSTDSLTLALDSNAVMITPLQKMYVDLNNKTYLYRYGFSVKIACFDEILTSSNLSMKLGSEYMFSTGKKWKKQRREIKTKADMLRRKF